MIRRDFIKSTGTATGIFGFTGLMAKGIVDKSPKRPICVFSKCLQFLDFDEMGELLAKLGFDGVDLSVRPGGHVEPEDVKAKLPLAVKTMGKNGLSVPMMVTSITDPSAKGVMELLQTAADNGIKYYRTGYYQYDFKKTISENLDLHKRSIEKLASMNEKTGIHGAYQNHSGILVGAPVWDLYELLKDTDPRYMGVQYDICHAVAEGGASWIIGMKRIAPWIRTIDIKDFVWNKNDRGEWIRKFVPLGEGMVNYNDFIKEYSLLNIEAPLSVHYEYNLGGAEGGKKVISMSREEINAFLKKDLEWLKDKLKSLNH